MFVIVMYILVELSVGCRKQPSEQKSLRGRDKDNKTISSSSEDDTANESDSNQKALNILRGQPITELNADAQVTAAKKLAANHCAEATPLLIAKLMTLRGTDVRDTSRWDQSFPAFDALAQIGEPAIPQITKRFEETSDEREEFILLRLIHRLKGKEWVIQYLDRLKAASSKADVDRCEKWALGFE